MHNVPIQFIRGPSKVANVIGRVLSCFGTEKKKKLKKAPRLRSRYPHLGRRELHQPDINDVPGLGTIGFATKRLPSILKDLSSIQALQDANNNFAGKRDTRAVHALGFVGGASASKNGKQKDRCFYVSRKGQDEFDEVVTS